MFKSIWNAMKKAAAATATFVSSAFTTAAAMVELAVVGVKEAARDFTRLFTTPVDEKSAFASMPWSGKAKVAVKVAASYWWRYTLGFLLSLTASFMVPRLNGDHFWASRLYDTCKNLPVHVARRGAKIVANKLTNKLMEVIAHVQYS